MLYVRIELWPYGFQESRKILGEATIANVGGDLKKGDYEYCISVPGGFEGDMRRPLNDSVGQEGSIHGFSRKLGFWELVWKVLVDARKNRTPWRRIE